MSKKSDLYDLRRWRRRSQLQRKRQPLCERCEAEGRLTIATLAHHVVPHNRNMYDFHCGALQSLCHNCHLIVHGRAPKNDTFIGLDGWPVKVQR